jgi:hypothetical protein
MRIGTDPRTPSTTRTMLSAPPPGGMQSTSRTAPSGLELRLEDQRARPEATRHAAHDSGWCEEPAAVALVAQQRGEADVRVEAR